MANTYKSDQQQCLLDVALHSFGTLEALFSVALSNERAITDLVSAGQELTLPDLRINERSLDVLRIFKNRDIVPATDIDNNKSDKKLAGIDYWKLSEYIVR